MGEEAWDCIVFFFGTERERVVFGVCFGLDWKDDLDWKEGGRRDGKFGDFGR